jgi:hypothetical protein
VNIGGQPVELGNEHRAFGFLGGLERGCQLGPAIELQINVNLIRCSADNIQPSRLGAWEGGGARARRARPLMDRPAAWSVSPTRPTGKKYSCEGSGICAVKGPTLRAE